VKENPSIVISALSAIGLYSSDIVEHINAFLSADMPGWGVLAIAAGYVGLRIIYDARKTQKDSITTMKQMAGDIRELKEQRSLDMERLADAEDRLDAGRKRFDDHEGRINVIEDVLAAEIEAYNEKTRRETGKITKEGEPS